jgi:NaMN:DMB phosphoribosyltransferase
MADPTTYALTGLDVDIRPGMVLPLPDDAAAAEARDRLSFMDLGIGGPSITSLGMLAEAVVFIAGVQGSGYPRPLLSTRVILFTGAHGGGLVAGPSPDPRHGLPLQHLAVTAGAAIVTLEWQPAAAAIEYEDAITPEQMEAAMRAGFTEAERAADEGIELLVLAAGGAGASTAAAAVVAATTGSEATSLIGRVATPAGLYDDNAWMTRCLAVRDALHRVRDRDGDPRSVLCALGGADIAAATGLLLGAAYRRTPVMIDGPVGAAAALLANDFSAQARRWVLLPDTGRHMAVRIAAEALDLHPWLDLCLDLGEGAAALAALPMLQTALTLAGAGEPVDPTPPTRFDSSGNQVFVGVARPVEPSEDLEEAATIDAGVAVGVVPASATVDTPTAEASTVDKPEKSAEKPPAKAAKAPTKGTPARSVSAPKESPVKEPAKPPSPRTGRSAKNADPSPTAGNPVVGGKTAGGTYPSRPLPAQTKGAESLAKATPDASTASSVEPPKPTEPPKPADAIKPTDTAGAAGTPKPADQSTPPPDVPPLPAAAESPKPPAPAEPARAAQPAEAVGTKAGAAKTAGADPAATADKPTDSTSGAADAPALKPVAADVSSRVPAPPDAAPATTPDDKTGTTPDDKTGTTPDGKTGAAPAADDQTVVVGAGAADEPGDGTTPRPRKRT